MPTQAEIDAAVERLREYMLTANLDEKPPRHVLEATCKLAIGYVDLTDPTPITPKLLEAEGFTYRPDVHDYANKGDTMSVANEDPWTFYWRTGNHPIEVKTMGGVRLAMMQARESVK